MSALAWRWPSNRAAIERSGWRISSAAGVSRRGTAGRFFARLAQEVPDICTVQERAAIRRHSPLPVRPGQERTYPNAREEQDTALQAVAGARLLGTIQESVSAARYPHRGSQPRASSRIGSATRSLLNFRPCRRLGYDEAGTWIQAVPKIRGRRGCSCAQNRPQKSLL